VTGPGAATPDAAGPGGDVDACTVMHVDLDAFFAAVEVLDDPSLAGKPVIVGGSGRRGVVAACTYEARAYGIHSAMSSVEARRRCPHAVFLSGRFSRYSEMSVQFHEVLHSFTPVVEGIALDEAFLDVSGAERRLGSPAWIGAAIRRQVEAEQGMTCSVGVAPSKFVAKIASVHCKPDGLLVVPRDGVLGFLHPLPTSALWGVGERTGEILARLGLRTVGDIAHAPVATLQHNLGAAVGSHLAALAWGRDPRAVTPHAPDKSIGAEETFATDISDPDVVRRELLRLSERTARSLREAGCVARTVTVKLRLANFTTMTRSRTLAEPSDLARKIYATACALYAGSGLDRQARLRLVGVRATGLVPASAAATQLAFGDRPAGWREAEQAMDRIAERFGNGKVRPAELWRNM